MTELRQNGTRFRVVELQGYTITPNASRGSNPPGISCSVLDSAFAWAEVARFGGKGVSRSRVRDLAEARAAELNEWDRLAS